MSTTLQRDLPGNSEHSANSLAPSLAPTDWSIPDDGFSPLSGSQNNVASEWAHERPFPTSVQSKPRGKLVSGVVIASALALGTAAYFFLSPAPEKTAAPTGTEVPASGSQSTAVQHWVGRHSPVVKVTKLTMRIVIASVGVSDEWHARRF